MTMQFLHKEDIAITNLLARIKGNPKKYRSDLQPLYNEPVPEPNKTKLISFYKNLLAEELSIGRIGVLLGNMYRISIWLKHRPFEELTKDDIIDLIEHIKNMKVKNNGKKTVKESYAEQTEERPSTKGHLDS
ncbi:MAG: hypothetical protein ACETWM_17315 [Candidatus Lokiarchaeia archaeon]